MDFIANTILVGVSIYVGYFIFVSTPSFFSSSPPKEITKPKSIVKKERKNEFINNLKKIYPKSVKINYPKSNNGYFEILFNPDENDNIFKILTLINKNDSSKIKSELLYKKIEMTDSNSEYKSCSRNYHSNGTISLEEYYNKEGVLTKKTEFKNNKLI